MNTVAYHRIIELNFYSNPYRTACVYLEYVLVYGLELRADWIKRQHICIQYSNIYKGSRVPVYVVACHDKRQLKGQVTTSIKTL